MWQHALPQHGAHRLADIAFDAKQHSYAGRQAVILLMGHNCKLCVRASWLGRVWQLRTRLALCEAAQQLDLATELPGHDTNINIWRLTISCCAVCH